MTMKPYRTAPDLGPVKMRPNPADPTAPLVNIAGIVAIAAQQDTPKARRFYGEFLKAWSGWKGRPVPENDRQAGALREALAQVGSHTEPRPAPEGSSR